MCSHNHHDHCECKHGMTPFDQSLEEVDFSRSIWGAASSGNISKVQYHLEKGADVNACDRFGYTPLHYAIKQEITLSGMAHGNNRLELCKLLLKKGASVNAKTKGGSTCLHRACVRGCINIANLLCQFGADLQAVDSDNKNMIHKAVEGNSLSILSFLHQTMKKKDFNRLAHDTDKQNRTPIQLLQDNCENFIEMKNYLTPC